MHAFIGQRRTCAEDWSDGMHGRRQILPSGWTQSNKHNHVMELRRRARKFHYNRNVKPTTLQQSFDRPDRTTVQAWELPPIASFCSTAHPTLNFSSGNWRHLSFWFSWYLRSLAGDWETSMQGRHRRLRIVNAGEPRVPWQVTDHTYVYLSYLFNSRDSLPTANPWSVIDS
jgi:hypothetical protein